MGTYCVERCAEIIDALCSNCEISIASAIRANFGVVLETIFQADVDVDSPLPPPRSSSA